MTLNEAQQAAVNSEAALRVVIAGPGSGKTRTMVEAVKATKVGSRVAIMTFTNAGANEFRTRLARQSDGAGGFTELDHLADRKLAYCGTLHGYCFRLIQRFGGLIGYIPGKVGILPDKERIPRLLACRDKLGFKISQKLLMEHHEGRPVVDFPTDIQEGVDLVWKEYEFLLKRNNLVDFDGILTEAVTLIALPEVKRQVKLDYLFVDEYQDSSALDQCIYDGIPATNKMYVGDPDQNVFSFRGAYGAGLTNMVLAKSKSVEVHKLEMNYRSDKAICQHANVLIRQNQARVDKWIKPVSSEMGETEVNNFEDVGQELSYLAARISGRMLGSFKLGETESIAVLYRMNHDVKQCRDYLRSMGIPIQEPKWEQRPPDWDRAMLLLGLCQSPDNEILAERYLRIDFEPAIVREFQLQSAVSGNSVLFTALPHTRFNCADSWPQHLASKGVSESTVRLIQARLELLAPDADLSDLLHDLHSNEEPKEASNEAGMYVGTIHSAKGREWDVVFLPAFEQGILPHIQKVKHDPRENPGYGGVPGGVGDLTNLEEERRLAFVAVTRARHELYISHCAHRRGPWGPIGQGRPSMFIKEMGL